MRSLKLVTKCLIERCRPPNRYRFIQVCQRYHNNSFQNSEYKQQYKQQKTNKNTYYSVVAIVGAGGLASWTAYKKLQALSVEDEEKTIKKSKKFFNYFFGSIQTNQKDEKNNNESIEKQYSSSDVAKHNSIERGVWITYKGNVYDITEFIKHHPGGSQTIMMGAGGDVEPFWETYTVHHASEVQALLAKYKIGKLRSEDRIAIEQNFNSGDENNPYASEPQRNSLLIVHTKQPFNAETPSKLLMPTYITPTDIFFVRNHLPVPEVDLNDYKLSVCLGTDGDPENLQVLSEFSLNELKTLFEPHSVDSVIQCSGNRRSDLKKIKEIKGLNWDVGAISNARWTGVKLTDLLDHLKINYKTKIASTSIKHVQLEGLDCDMTGQSYGASVSADLAFDPNKEVLLAYEMNGQPLTRDHGFPLRFVAPGVTGARNVKWLSKIILSHEESNSHWQRKDYKSFSPNIDMYNLNFDHSASIQETPVQSAICNPVDGEQVLIKCGNPNQQTCYIPVMGYAYSGGGKMIVRVDVSLDGGQSWTTAKLEDTPVDVNGFPDYTRRNQVYSWSRWSVDLPVANDLLNSGEHVKILCRAFDSSYNSQPERAQTIWNVRGVVNNSWHQINVKLKTESNK